MNHKQIFLLTLIALMATSCVVPGLSSASPTSQPAPTLTPDPRLSAMVAELVSGALTQTALAVPPTPAPTFTPAPTSTPTALPSVGSSLTAQDDKSVLFVDERAGYKAVIPQGWLAVRVNEQEYLSALKSPEAADPLIQSALLGIEKEDPLTFRLFAVDLREGHIKDETVTTLQFVWDEKGKMAFNSDEDIQAAADNLTKTVAGLEVTAVDMLFTPAKMQFGVIESETQSLAAATLRQKRVFFNASNGLVTVTLTTVEDLTETVIPAFDAIMDTIKPIQN